MSVEKYQAKTKVDPKKKKNLKLQDSVTTQFVEYFRYT